MKKQMTFMIAILFVFVFFLGMASATLSFSSIGKLNHSDGTFNITITSNTNETVTLNVEKIIQGSEEITFSLDNSSFALNNSNKTVTITYDVSEGFNFYFGKTYSSVLNASGETSPLVKKTMTFERTSFCEFGEKGDLDITQVNINNLGKGDDSEWEFLDQIEIEVSVNNNNRDNSVSSVKAEIIILNENGKDVTNDFFEDSRDKILDYGRISSDTEETEKTILKIDPRLNEGNYKIYVKAYKSGGEDLQCDETNHDFIDNLYEEIRVLTGDREVGIDEFDYPSTVTCDSSNAISFKFYNFDLSEKEENMRVSLYNKDLGLNMYSNKFDLRKGKSEKLYFNIDIPSDVKSGRYIINIRYDYDYNKNDESYRESQQADESFNLIVGGNCYADLTPSITAEMVSKEAVEGKELIIRSTISNDDVAALFGVHAEGYESWAELIEVTPQLVNIDVNGSQEFLFKFKLKNDAAGEQTFNVVVTSGNHVLSSQSVAVEVAKSSFDLTSLFEGWDWTTIGIVVLNVILIFAILIVSIKVIKRR